MKCETVNRFVITVSRWSYESVVGPLRTRHVTECKKNRRGREPPGPRPRRLTLRRTTRITRAALRLVIRQIQIVSGDRRSLVPCRLPQNIRQDTSCGGRKQEPGVPAVTIDTTSAEVGIAIGNEWYRCGRQGHAPDDGRECRSVKRCSERGVLSVRNLPDDQGDNSVR